MDWSEARVLVVVAHSDDEVLGCGATLAGLRHARVVHVTDGAPRNGADAALAGFRGPDDYARARRAEAETALRLAGVDPVRLIGLGIADQQVSLHLDVVARALVPLLETADVVLTHAFEGGHSDHDGVAFTVQAAARLSRSSPENHEMPFYFGDRQGWVRQHFLPQAGAGQDFTRVLTVDERDLKARMVAAHATQAETLRSFDLSVERFRPAPAYDFLRRPHDGPLLYERHGWNLCWADWCARVVAAERALGLERVSCG